MGLCSETLSKSNENSKTWPKHGQNLCGRLFQDYFLFTWYAEGESGMTIFVTECEITLGNDVHTDDYFVIFVVIFEGKNICNDTSRRKADMHKVGVGLNDAIYT